MKNSLEKYFLLKGFTFIDVIVGTSLSLIVFLGIFGAYNLIIKVIATNQNKIIALYIAQAEMEKIRNLSYGDIGVIGDFPEGIIERTKEITMNNIIFIVETRVDYVVDSLDGLNPPDDDCPNDYKKIIIKVYYNGKFKVSEELTFDISPKNLGEECEEMGGIISVSVFNAYGEIVNSPLIEIKDPETKEVLKDARPEGGNHLFLMPEGRYLINVSKEGYSEERTYSMEEVAIPEKPNPYLLTGGLLELSFQIDLMSSLVIKTFSPWGMGYFFDVFEDTSKISDSLNIIVNDGVFLEEDKSFGFFSSIVTRPVNLINWSEFSFNDTLFENTSIRYFILHEGEKIPNNVLSGNEEGFTFSPVNLSNLNIEIYDSLSILVQFEKTGSLSPTLHNLQLSFIDEEPFPIANVSLDLRGNKTLGLDEEENIIYKYKENFISNQDGIIEIPLIEADLYNFEVENFFIIDEESFNLLPGEESEFIVNIKSDNSLFLTILNEDTLRPVFSSIVTIEKSDFEEIKYTNEKGQVFFTSIEGGNYSVNVSGPGYENFSKNSTVLGNTMESIKIKQIE